MRQLASRLSKLAQRLGQLREEKDPLGLEASGNSIKVDEVKWVNAFPRPSVVSAGLRSERLSSPALLILPLDTPKHHSLVLRQNSLFTAHSNR